MSVPSPQRTEVPEHIGPYRVEHRLGEGGMGEVYAGYDERLDRPVALKRIRPDAPGSDQIRHAFQNEARAAARLRHPAIVQVYDWVESPEGDWIVLELVEGRSLRWILRNGGPLEPRRAAGLARDVLAGLAVAHETGIVHRDLKAENVMVTSAREDSGEEARILDFGIARPAATTGQGDEPESDPIAGTASAMSPEQILKRPVDGRSDLFALGSLLYEMLTGRHPFLAATSRQTLDRVCTHEPPPLESQGVRVPLGLARLVERLLEKDPRRRPEHARQALAELEAVLPELEDTAPATPIPADPPPTVPWGPTLWSRWSHLTSYATRERSSGAPRHRAWSLAATLVVGLGLGIWAALASPEPRTSEALYVAVPAPRVSAPPDATSARAFDLELAAGAMHTSLLQGLSSLPRVAALEPAGDIASPEPRALARTLAADEVLTSRLTCGEVRCQAVLRRHAGEDGRVLWTRSFSVEPTEPLALATAVLGHVHSGFSTGRDPTETLSLPVRARDYRDFLELRQALDLRRVTTDQALASLETLQEGSPRFVALHLFEALVGLRRFQEERDPADLQRAEAAVRRARSLAPEDPQVLARQAQVTRIAGRPEQAEAALEKLLRLEPANALTLAQMALLLEETGRPEQALERMREAVDRLPSTGHLLDLADMLYRRGDVEGARGALEAVLERSPRHYDALSRLAQIELLAGSPERAGELYERLVERSPGVVELSNLGTSHLLTGRYDEAARRFRQARELAPKAAGVLLNLADAEWLHGNRDEARDLYRRVLERVAEDPRPETLDTIRAQALAHLERPRDAVEAVRGALDRFPDNPATLYEAALVFVLVGNEEQAARLASRALEEGLEPVWLDFPWFDPIRGRLRSSAS